MTVQQALWRFFVQYIIFELVLLAAIGAFGLLSGWSTTTEYCNALFIVGAAIIMLGISRVRVNQAERNFNSQYAATVGNEDAANRTRRMALESALSFATSARMMLYGFTPIILSLVILAVWGW